MSRWTGDMEDVAEICGDAIAQSLFVKAGKCHIYIPREGEQETSPFSMLDESLKKKLTEDLPGARLYVSSPADQAVKSMAEFRRKRVRELSKAGKKPTEIAIELGVSEMTVYRHLSDKKAVLADTRQQAFDF